MQFFREQAQQFAAVFGDHDHVFQGEVTDTAVGLVPEDGFDGKHHAGLDDDLGATGERGWLVNVQA